MTQPETEPPAQFHVGDFRALLRARAGFLRRVFLLLALPGLLLGALLPARYKAEATLTVLPAPEFTVRQDAGSRSFSAAMLALDQIMKSETAILASDDLHAATIGPLGLDTVYPDIARPDPPGIIANMLGGAWRFLSAPWLPGAPVTPMQRGLDRFSRHMRVLPAKDSNVITVSFTHPDAQMAARALNRMLADYAQRRSSLYNDPQLAVVRTQLAGLAQTARGADQKLSAFKAAHDISNFEAERALLLRRRDQLATDLATAQAEQAALQAKCTALAQQIQAAPPSAALYEERDATQVQAIDGAILDLQGKIAAAREHYRDGSRHVRELQIQLRARQQERGQALHDPTIAASRNGRTLATDQLVISRSTAVSDLAAAQARGVRLAQSLAELSASVRALDAQEAALNDLQRQKTAAEDAYTNTAHVLAEQGLTEAEDSLRLANVRLVQQAMPPTAPVPIKILLALGGMLGGALAGLGLVLVEYTRRPLLFTADGIAHLTGLPVLGVFDTADDLRGSVI